jgi:predicted nucleotidyltransferase
MPSKKEIERIKGKVIPILKPYGLKRLGLFGSFVRGETRKKSDIDILVELTQDISLLEFVGLKLEIEEALGKKIDLVEYNSIKPRLRQRVLSEQIVLL